MSRNRRSDDSPLRGHILPLGFETRPRTGEQATRYSGARELKVQFREKSATRDTPWTIKVFRSCVRRHPKRATRQMKMLVRGHIRRLATGGFGYFADLTKATSATLWDNDLEGLKDTIRAIPPRREFLTFAKPPASQ